MSILISWLGPLRAICMAIDGVAFSLLDNAYNIVIELSKAELLQRETIETITRNLYILFGVVAFFRLAMVLVNSIIDPEKLNEKGKGLSNIFFRVVGMIILLIVTPFLFEMSYDLQGKIVGADPSQNIIFRTILGDSSNISGENAGKALQNIALSSLITIDNNYLEGDGTVCEYKRDEDGNITDYNTFENAGECGFAPLVCAPNGDGTCTPQGGYIYDEGVCDWGNCQKAVDRYNQMYVAENMQPSKLAAYAGVSEKIDVDGEEQEVYVYNYMMIVTTVVGIFMTYIVISFAIDIAVRMFELVALEILSPLFIATFVDPKSTQSGPFKNWLSAVGKSYANLYIKLAVLALVVFLVSIINQSHMFSAMGDVGGLAKVFVVIGLLIFAKKAPKWIMDIIGIKGDGMGLWTPKKLAENMAGGALAGRLAGKAGRGLAGVANSTARNLRSASRDRNKRRKDALKNANLGSRKDRRQALSDIKTNDGKKGLAAWRALNERKRNAMKDAGVEKAISSDAAKKAFGATMAGIKGGFTAGVKADNLRGALKASSEESTNWKDSTGLQGKTLKERFEDSAKRTYGKTQTLGYGDPLYRQEQADLRKKEKFIEDMYGKDFLKNAKNSLSDLDYSKLINGTGRFLSVSNDSEGVAAKNLPDALQMNIAQACGYATKYNGEGKLEFYKEFDKETGKVIESSKITDSSTLSAIKTQAQNSLSDEGAAKMQSLFNMKTGNIISDFGKNEANIDAAQQAIKNLSDSMKAFSGNVDKVISTIPESIRGAFDFDKSTGKINVNLDKVPGLEDMKTSEISSRADLAELISGLQSKTDISAEGKELLNSLNIMNGDASIAQHLNYTSLLKARNDDLTTYIEREKQMALAYEWAGYKMIGDDGKILFDEDALKTKLAEVKNVSSDEKVRKQQSQEGRIKDLEAAIEKKKADEGNK